MANQQTKNSFIIDHDEKYIPVVRTAAGEIQTSASFSLAEESLRSGQRLKRLIDFIHRNNSSSTRRNHNGDSVGVTHRLAAQVVYLAYWENYPFEFWLEENGGTTVILARFSRPKTSASVAWNSIPEWTAHEGGPDERTPNFASVVQEVVGRPGWTSGNAMSIIITGSGRRLAKSYEYYVYGAP